MLTLQPPAPQQIARTMPVVTGLDLRVAALDPTGVIGSHATM